MVLLNLSFGLKEKSKDLFYTVLIICNFCPLIIKLCNLLILQDYELYSKTIYKQVKKLNIRQIFTGIYSYIRQYCYYWVLFFSSAQTGFIYYIGLLLLLLGLFQLIKRVLLKMGAEYVVTNKKVILKSGIQARTLSN